MPEEHLRHETTIAIPATDAAFALVMVAEAIRLHDKRKRRAVFKKVVRGLRAFDLIPPGEVTTCGIAIDTQGGLVLTLTLETPR